MASLLSSKQRSFLALIGISIGIGSVIAMISCGDDRQRGIRQEIPENGHGQTCDQERFQRCKGAARQGGDNKSAGRPRSCEHSQHRCSGTLHIHVRAGRHFRQDDGAFAPCRGDVSVRGPCKTRSRGRPAHIGSRSPAVLRRGRILKLPRPCCAGRRRAHRRRDHQDRRCRLYGRGRAAQRAGRDRESSG